MTERKRQEVLPVPDMHPAPTARRPGLYRRFGKRLLDLALTVPAGLVALPVVALLALVARAT